MKRRNPTKLLPGTYSSEAGISAFNSFLGLLVSNSNIGCLYGLEGTCLLLPSCLLWTFEYHQEETTTSITPNPNPTPSPILALVDNPCGEGPIVEVLLDVPDAAVGE